MFLALHSKHSIWRMVLKIWTNVFEPISFCYIHESHSLQLDLMSQFWYVIPKILDELIRFWRLAILWGFSDSTNHTTTKTTQTLLVSVLFFHCAAYIHKQRHMPVILVNLIYKCLYANSPERHSEVLGWVWISLCKLVCTSNIRAEIQATSCNGDSNYYSVW